MLVRNPVFLSADTMASTALDKVSVLSEKVTTLLTHARNYAAYAERFGNSLAQKPAFEYVQWIFRNFELNMCREFLLVEKRDDSATQEIQMDLGELERDLTLRKLLWDSLVTLLIKMPKKYGHNKQRY